MSIFRTFSLALGLIVFAAPAGAAWFGPDPTRQIEYTPSSSFVVHGAVQVGAFAYPPGEGKLKPNQIRNHGMGDILLSQDIGAFLHDSLLKELRFVGVKIDRGPVIAGEIKEFSVNEYDANLTTLTVRYVVTDAQGTVLYDAEKTVAQNLFGPTVTNFDRVLKSSFEVLFADAAFRKAIDPGSTPAPMAVPAPQPMLSLVYRPASPFIAGGAVAIGTFDYLPAAGGKVAPDQIRNTALGNIHLDRTVAAYVGEAILKELRLTGVTVESNDRVLGGTIVELACDDLGYSSDWVVDVKYVVRDGAGAVVYEGEKVTKIRTAKYLDTVNDALRRNFEALLLDDAFLKAIGAPEGTHNTAESAIPFDSFAGTETTGYGPRSALVAHGAVSVGPFAYLLAGPKTKANEIPCTALMTTVYLDRPVAEVMQAITLNELRFIGIDVRGTDRVLTGEIQKYKVDNIADPAEWTIAVHFTVKDKAGATLYDAVKSATPTNTKFLYNFREMQTVIEALVSDPDFIKAIN
jgi:hypothetical protein